MHQWLDNWSGIGLVIVGMERQGYALSLRKVEDKWMASFTMIRRGRGFGAATTPWGAVQIAAWAPIKLG